ncbi:hypothetical protein ANANG_G00274590 [Anguilla anguilla]|uniref:Uncharacterized protein n=1 Tax=Anguilla anguilla TaxID=7936 RepID=A0A9D3RKC3_ANGAN|nr:hypothetical protein ANANG_G00274590 [Anguilla anguilla]
MDAILTYSKSAEELLKRRKVYREVIFKYLISEGIVMPPDADKNQLARRALLFWALNSSVKSNKASYVSTPADEEMDFSSAGEEISACDYMALGKQFCQWFYNLVNTQNPTLGQEPLHWGPQHFWEDAWLILCYSAEVQKIDRFQGAELVSQNLLALVRDERLFFSPNLEPHGLKCEATPHGLAGDGGGRRNNPPRTGLSGNLRAGVRPHTLPTGRQQLEDQVYTFENERAE